MRVSLAWKQLGSSPNWRWHKVYAIPHHKRCNAQQLVVRHFIKAFIKIRAIADHSLTEYGQSYKYQVGTVDFRGHFHNELNVELTITSIRYAADNFSDLREVSRYWQEFL